MKVIKRNGQYVDFNEDKIYNAISKANKECKDNNEKVINDNLLGYIVKIISETLHSLNRAVSVEEIQDIVEKNIAELGFYNVSKRYIKYRYKRELARNDYDELMKAVKEKNQDRVVLAGGVGANSKLKEELQKECDKQGIKLYTPKLDLCTDNAAMIASHAYYQLISTGEIAELNLTAKSTVPLE